MADDSISNVSYENKDDLFVFSPFKESEAERTETTNYSYWKSTIHNFVTHKGGVAAFILMILIITFAFIQPYLPNQQPHNFTEYLTDFEMWKNPPSAKHWFGTDDIGRDMWARVWEGTRISISLAALVAITETIIGLIIGAVWGYVKKIDRIMTEIYNVMANIPTIVLLILLTYILTPGYWTMFLAMSLTGWLYMAKFIRNQIFIIRDREYNMASKCLGTPLHRMIARNLIPHLVSVIIMRLALSIPQIIANETFLTYLGMGLPLEVPSLGVLLSAGQSVFSYRPHLLVFPALLISLITVSFYVVGNIFSDASDPRNHT